ncbi:hypothetical protein, partial [Pseudomonas aeruginosa]
RVTGGNARACRPGQEPKECRRTFFISPQPFEHGFQAADFAWEISTFLNSCQARQNGENPHHFGDIYF